MILILKCKAITAYNQLTSEVQQMCEFIIEGGHRNLNNIWLDPFDSFWSLERGALEWDRPVGGKD